MVVSRHAARRMARACWRRVVRHGLCVLDLGAAAAPCVRVSRRRRSVMSAEEQRHEEDREERRGDHAAHHAGAGRVARAGAGAGRDRERQHAEDERERRHQDRPEPQARRFDRRGRRRHAFVLLQHRVLDDQDRVLRGEAEQRDEADLEVDVVGESAQPDRGQRAERAERQRQQHRERQRPLLVLRGEDQEHHDHREAERERRRAARALLLVRRAAPVVAEVRRAALRWRSARRARSPGPSCTPGAAWPKILTAGRLLKRSSESGPGE